MVVGRVADVATYDDGKLAVAAIAAERTLKGTEADGPVRVLEMRPLPSVPALLRGGDHVVAFLVAARLSSYVRGHVPAGTYWQATSADGVIAAADAASVAQAAALVERMVTASREPEPDPAKRKAAERALVFDELAARHPALVEDGIAGLGELPALLPLSDAERGTLAGVVARDDLPARVRERLFAQVASLRLEELVPALRAVRSSDAAVTAAAWQALRSSVPRPGRTRSPPGSRAAIPRCAPPPPASCSHATSSPSSIVPAGSR